jgi:hypothetical protein
MSEGNVSLKELEDRVTRVEDNLIRIVTAPQALTFVQKYASVLILAGVLAGAAFGHLVK